MDHASRRATERVLRLTTIIWGAAWFLSLVTTMAGSPGLSTASGLSVTCLALLAASWLVLAFAPRAPSWQFVSVATATALVNAGIVDLAPLENSTLLVTTWLNLATISAALLLPRLVAPAVIVGVCAAAMGILIVRLVSAGALDRQWNSAVMAFAYGIAVGMAVWVAATTLRAAGDLADVLARDLRRTTRERAGRRAHRDEVERLTRLLHDTCINTLGAIRGGIGGHNADAVRERCASDLAQMDRLARDVGASTLPRLPELAATTLRESRLLGLDVEADIEGDDGYPVNPVVWQAASGAVREALVNVAKHSGVSAAELHVRVDETNLTVTVSDRGHGWTGPVPPGGGLERSIRGRVDRSGGLVRITSDEQLGTTISMTWPKTLAMAPPPDRDADQPDIAVTHGDTEEEAAVIGGMRRIVLGSGGWMLAYCVIVTAVCFAETPSAGSILALLVMALWLWFAARWSHGPLPLWLTWLLAAGLAVVVALPAQETPGCAATNPAAWGADGATVLVLIMCLLGASWWNPFAALLGFALGLGLPLVLASGTRDCATATLAVFVIEVGTVAVIFAFRRILVRLWAKAGRDRLEALRVEAIAIEAAARERAREARLRSAVSSASPLLMRVADGEADPSDPAVMKEAAEQETALRSLLVLDSDLGRLGDALAGALVDALDRGRRIEIRAGEPVASPSRDQIELIREVLDLAVLATPANSVVAVALFGRPDGGVMTVVAPVSVRVLGAGDVTRLALDGLTVSQVELEDEVLMEVQWTAE
jgi:signal transduction histidine kinase